MSIVERAIKKLQATGQSPRPHSRRPDPSTAVGRVVEDQHPGPVDATQPRLQALIGNVGKTVVIDYEALRRNRLLPPESQQREFDHQYRILKRPLIKHAFKSAAGQDRVGVSSRTIMVTSALPGEGKTFTAINLALSLSMEKDHGVLLVDGDVAKPRVSHLFGVADEPGLLDVLSERERSIESVVLPTDVPGLSILPAGRGSDTATELLASDRMRQKVIERLSELDPNGLVVVDSPPMLLTSEARVLASLFGQIVLVVRANYTPQQAVQQAIGLIGEGPRLGLVLNQALHEGPGDGYGYGYGYGYGDAAKSEKDAEPHTPRA
jgi:protein-tyrosine kinase